jgi:hypothetical protein
VRLRPTYPATCTALTLAAALCGCAPSVFDNNQHWFSRPFDITGRNSGYTFSELQESRDKSRPVTASDLVSADGACPPPPGATAGEPVSAPGAGAAPVAQASGAGDSTAAPAPGAPSLLGTGIALGMTECEVVWHVGAPSSVQIGSNPNGGRTALMTFDRGPQAGIYHFERGRLRAMDGAQASAARPKVATRAKRARREPSRTEQISTE